MKLSLLTARLLIIAISIVCFTGCESMKKDSLAATLKAQAAAVPTPQNVEDGLRLDSVSAKDLSIRFSYTMTGYAKGDLDLPVFYKLLKADILKRADTSDDMAFYKKNKIKVSFAYYFKDGQPLSTIIVRPEDYTNSEN